MVAFGVQFYGPVNTVNIMSSRSVNLLDNCIIVFIFIMLACFVLLGLILYHYELLL